jgi:hypothetical protein
MRMRACLPLVNLAAAVAVAAAAGLALIADRRGSEAQALPVISVPSCLEIEEGDTFEIEVTITNVSGLAAWELYFAYDRELLEVAGRSVRLFLDQQPNSNVFDFSEPVPNTTGLYRLGAADLSTEGDTAESGSGVLATISLVAKESGVSWAEIYRADLNGDDTIDFGPTLTGARGAHIADSDGNGIFDGTIRSGQVAIGESCQQPAPTAPPPDGVIIQPSVSPSVTTGSPGPGGATPGANGGADATGDATPAPGSSQAPAASTATPGPGVANPQSGRGGDGGGGWLLYAVIIAGATAAAIGAGWAFMSIRRTA